MADQYKTMSFATGEVEEKRSRFLATIRHVESPEEMQAFVAEMRKTYWDARHNCSACIIGKDRAYRHSSDDGEPSGCAGRPMLDVLDGAGLTDVAVVVTRYFGGTLLGTGGLVRAYSEAVRAALKQGEIEEKRFCQCLSVTADYNRAGKLQHLFRQQEIPILDAVYGEQVQFLIAVPPERVSAITTQMQCATEGQAVIREKQMELI